MNETKKTKKRITQATYSNKNEINNSIDLDKFRLF